MVAPVTPADRERLARARTLRGAPAQALIEQVFVQHRSLAGVLADRFSRRYRLDPEDARQTADAALWWALLAYDEQRGDGTGYLSAAITAALKDWSRGERDRREVPMDQACLDRLADARDMRPQQAMDASRALRQMSPADREIVSEWAASGVRWTGEPRTAQRRRERLKRALRRARARAAVTRGLESEG